MSTPDRYPSRPEPGIGPDSGLRQRNVALVDLLDRVLAGGVVIAGEVTLSIADVDLVRISLRALIASVRSLAAEPVAERGREP
ncbi:gas vesicle protein [Kitasatospora cineracea]|uniref:Gas vesicle protein GvpA/GvpJ/GvpM family n=1 Tax=Kitasatospora cineracea TaxID=88074 RepID=A0A3N4RTE4_9ACTN|nr:gas vesicle protein GvpA/GvpJ/GvpM family [Kitasatospora cineracea]